MARRLKTVPGASILTPSRTDEFLLADSNTSVHNLVGTSSGSHFTLSKSNVAQNTSGGYRAFIIDFAIREGLRGNRGQGSGSPFYNGRFPGVEVSDNQSTTAVTSNFAQSTYNSNMEIYNSLVVFGDFYGTVNFKFTAQRASNSTNYNGGYFCNVQIIDGLNYGLRTGYYSQAAPRTSNTSYHYWSSFFNQLTNFDSYASNIPRWAYGASMMASTNSSRYSGSFGWSTYSLEDMRAYTGYWNHNETNYKGYDTQYLNGSGSSTSRETLAYYRKGQIAINNTPFMWSSGTRYAYYRIYNSGGITNLSSGLLI